ncbi:hypothetical protein [Burkholderia sp. JKS000303]|uniref:hypothetical protein n=1 Tax=Burkholderia sp. JKS000303 TaxID=1938747 RepID=UPI0015CF38E5|nr:hypothetical protein [Burkholderia sp. JKS000303]
MEKTPMIADTISDIKNIENNKPKDKPVSDPKVVLSTICLPACIIDGRGYVVSLNDPWRKLINPSIDPQKIQPLGRVNQSFGQISRSLQFLRSAGEGNLHFVRMQIERQRHRQQTLVYRNPSAD